MDEPIPGAAASAPRKRRSRPWAWVSLGAALALGLLFARMARDDRNPFEKMRDDWSRAERAYAAASSGAKTAEARRKIAAELLPKPDAYAERCLELARSQPDTPAELAALCWAVSNAPASKPGKEAFAVLQGGRLEHAEPAE